MKFTQLKSTVLALLLAQGASSFAQSAAPAQPPEPTLDIQRYVVDGDNPLSADETSALLAPFVGPSRKISDIEDAASTLERAMRQRGFAFHRMFVPVQKPTAGEIRLQVIGIKLGTVEVSGNEKFTTDNIRRSLTSLKEGEVPEVQSLGRDVSASNTNPAKQVAVTFKESAKPGEVDAVVKVKDSPTAIFFAGLTGNQAVSNDLPSDNTWRITGGFQHANLFDRDQVMTLSYTTDPSDISGVTLFGAYYQLPLYGTGMNISAYYTHSDVDSGQVQQGGGVFDVSGSGRFAGIRLNRVLNRHGGFQHAVGISYDERWFENSTTFQGALLQPDVGSRVLAVQYSFRNEFGWGDISGALDYLANVGGGPDNTTASHALNGGEKNWDALRFNFEGTVPASGWLYTGRLKGQFSGKSLISGEQFGLGGSYSVRGFADRVVSGDYGAEWSLEAMGPPISSVQLRPVAFLDGGQVHDRSTNNTETLMSTGIGLRLVYQNLQVALDLAQVLDANSTQSGKPTRMHMAMTYRF